MKRKALYLAAPLALGLVACGGGGGTSPAGSGFVSVMVTDAISTQYTKVWVTVTKVTVQDGAGTVIELFNDPAGKVLNLTELKGVSNLLSTQSLTAGDYTKLKITMKSAVTLNDNTATPITATLDPTTITVGGTFTVGGGAISIGIDFDLANFSYDQNTGIVTPTLVLRDHKTMQALSQAYAGLKGTIKSVPSSNLTDFVMTIDNGADAKADVTVTLLGNASVYVDDGTYSHTPGVFTDNQVLRNVYVGKPVEVYGNYDPTTLHIDAVRVRAASSSQTDASVFGSDKLEGRAIGKLPSGVQVDVREANFTPTRNSLIVNVSNAKFDKGSASDFTNALSQTKSLRVEMRGDWDGTTFTPKIIGIEGASRDRTAGTPTADIVDPYVEVRGQVQGGLSADGASFTMSVLATNHDDTTGNASIDTTMKNTGGNIDVNISQGWFKSGRSACITDQAYVEVKGSWKTQSVLYAHAIDIKGACSFANEPVKDIEDAANQNNGATQHPDAKGKITAIDLKNNTLTMEIFRAKGLSGVAVGTRITVSFDLSNTTPTLFDRGTSADLTVGGLIEVNAHSAAGWNAPTNTLTAGKIEFL